MEVLFVACAMATLSAIAVAQVSMAIERGRAVAAARYMTGRMALARSEAVKRSRAVGIRFEGADAGYRFGVFVDGNHNGVRTRDIADGVDPPLGPADHLPERFPGVAFALRIDDQESAPVRFGVARILTFTPLGTATPGTLYIRGRDGSQFAVRVLGQTGRVRLQQYLPGERTWTDF